MTEQFPEPNSGFERDPEYLAEKQAHANRAGRLVSVHRLRPTARKLEEIIGGREYAHLQDMWAQSPARNRWSVAFPIVETYEIQGAPKAKDILGDDLYKKIYARSSGTLRELDDDARHALADLELERRPAANAWIAIEDDFLKAEQSQISEESLREIGRDLDTHALEGDDLERWQRVVRRAAWMADKFIRRRQQTGKLRCDHCDFEPSAVFDPQAVNPRSLLDVHHLEPLAEGVRYTSIDDFALLCPTCHRIEHARLKHGVTPKGRARPA